MAFRKPRTLAMYCMPGILSPIAAVQAEPTSAGAGGHEAIQVRGVEDHTHVIIERFPDYRVTEALSIA